MISYKHLSINELLDLICYAEQNGDIGCVCALKTELRERMPLPKAVSLFMTTLTRGRLHD